MSNWGARIGGPIWRPELGGPFWGPNWGSRMGVVNCSAQNVAVNTGSGGIWGPEWWNGGIYVSVGYPGECGEFCDLGVF